MIEIKMMSTFLRAAVVMAWFWSSSLATAFDDGNDLLRLCKSTNPFEKYFCAGYVEAISDALDAGTVAGFRGCVDIGVHTSQLTDIVVQYLQRNPSQRHLGGGLVAAAISQAFPFPCRRR
jgi:hypothetical protein